MLRVGDCGPRVFASELPVVSCAWQVALPRPTVQHHDHRWNRHRYYKIVLMDLDAPWDHDVSTGVDHTRLEEPYINNSIHTAHDCYFYITYAVN